MYKRQKQPGLCQTIRKRSYKRPTISSRNGFTETDNTTLSFSSITFSKNDYNSMQLIVLSEGNMLHFAEELVSATEEILKI